MKYVNVELKQGEQLFTFRCMDDYVQPDDLVVAPVQFPHAKTQHLSVGTVVEVFDTNPSSRFTDAQLNIVLGVVNTTPYDMYKRQCIRDAKETELFDSHKIPDAYASGEL